MICKRPAYELIVPGSLLVAERRSIRETTDGCAAEADGEGAPAEYLKDVPQLPDFLAHLAGRKRLTEAEQLCISRHVDLIAGEIRKARQQWETRQADAADCR